MLFRRGTITFHLLRRNRRFGGVEVSKPASSETGMILALTDPPFGASVGPSELY